MENYDIFSFPFTYSATHSLIVPHKENYYVLGLRLPRVAVVRCINIISHVCYAISCADNNKTAPCAGKCKFFRAPLHTSFCLKSTPSSITWTGLESFIGEFPLRASQAYYTRHSKASIVYHASPYLASQFMS